MAKNDNAQTLFRFVSLRNPKLAETKKSNLGFIQRPEKMEGFFDKVLQGSDENSKFKALLSEASILESDSIIDIEELCILGFEKLINFGKNVSNQDILSTNDLNSCKEFYIKFINDSATIKKLWDNLIYQVITQKDFYIKENIAFIIKALHIGYIQTLTVSDELKKLNGNDLLASGLNAIIVLPKEIFDDNATFPLSANRMSSDKLSLRQNNSLIISSRKNQAEQNYAFEKMNFEQLYVELKSIQQNYFTSYTKAYNAFYKKFNIENSTVIDAFQKKSRILNELKISKASDDEIKKAEAELVKLDVPSFNFEFKNELNWEDIYNKLKSNSFGWFLHNFSDFSDEIDKPIDLNKVKLKVISDKELSLDGNPVFFTEENYNEIFTKIDTQIEQLSKNLISKILLPQDEFINLAGVLIPISKNNTQIVHLSFVLQTFKPASTFLSNTNLGYASFQVQVENESWSVSNAIFTAETNLGTQTENYDLIEVIDNKIVFAQFLINKFKEINSLTLQIFFSNGNESYLQLTNIEINAPVVGLLSLNSNNETLFRGREKGSNDNQTVKHFGLKRLGVAEYLKVVQTIHAYVPGEVSNIENVMASELRHKSVNELTRTENTITTSKSQEVEKVSDTIKTDRTEMQTEVSKVIDSQQSYQAHANFSKQDIWKIDLGTSFASTNAQQTSNMQAVTKSIEITEKAMERVQSKISEERIMKIIQEVSQTNVHEFDNRGSALSKNGPQHITGVYRWVDKKMKNQIYNYGKRTMFEFMIPEPAKLHRFAHSVAKGQILIAPLDPRTATDPHTMTTGLTSTTELLQYWANIYGVTLTTLPAKTLQHHIGLEYWNFGGDNGQRTKILNIPQNYTAKYVTVYYGYEFGYMKVSNFQGGILYLPFVWRGSIDSTYSVGNLNITGSYAYQYQGQGVDSFNVSFMFNCELSDDYMLQWRNENFNEIIKAYDAKYALYQAAQEKLDAEQKAKEADQKETQVNFYRIIESDILKHNCIAYLLQDHLATLGKQFTFGGEMRDFSVLLNENLDEYTALAKFLEQAFEWSIKDYTFYPYYWANRAEWKKMYLSESVDPLFRSFLQAGMARVIVTVKPGFEEAVQYFLVTGKVWFGGITPVIGDPLYMSIAQEMREPTGKPQGKYWITRIPTTLTIIQAKSTGLDVDDALPIFIEKNPANCENPDELEKDSAFNAEDVQMVASDKKTTLPNNILNP